MIHLWNGEETSPIMLLDALLHSPFETASAPVAQPSKPPPADASSEAEQPLECIAETVLQGRSRCHFADLINL